MVQRATLTDPLPTRIRIRVGDGVPIVCEEYRKTWLPVSADWETMADVVAAAQTRHLFALTTQSKMVLHVYVKGYAVLPEERLRGFIHHDDVLEFRLGTAREGPGQISTAEISEKSIEQAVVVSIPDPQIRCSNTTGDAYHPSKKRRQKRKRSKESTSHPAIFCDQSIVESPLVGSEDIDIGLDGPDLRLEVISAELPEKRTLSERHIRFSNPPAAPIGSDSGGSVDIETHKKYNSTSFVCSGSSTPGQRSDCNTPEWITNRLTSSRQKDVADPESPIINKSDDDEEYDAALMGRELSEKQDFRKKPYCVLTSVHTVKSVAHEVDELAQYQELLSDMILQTGDVILFKRVDLCEETWQVSVSSYLKALVGWVSGPVNKKIYDVDLHLFDSDGQIVGNPIRLSFGSMTSVRLISGPTLSTLLRHTENGGASTDATVLDCFRQELQSKRLKLL